eukprot:Opistho-2@52657
MLCGTSVQVAHVLTNDICILRVCMYAHVRAGGLAAPLIAAGAGTFIGAGGAGFLATTSGAALLGVLFGTAGGGLTGFKMARRTGSVNEFSFEHLGRTSGLHAVICVTGWLGAKSHTFARPWRHLQECGDRYSLRWESKELRNLGRVIEDMITSQIIGYAASQAIQQTVLAGLVAAIVWPAALLQVADIIDNPWGICMSRAEEAGKVLADVLSRRLHGHRPVNLIGYSLGAKIIFHALEELAGRKVPVRGIIGDVFIFGAPIPAGGERWIRARSVVAGRFVNGYCTSDWLLKFLYRTASAERSAAGLGPVGEDGRSGIAESSGENSKNSGTAYGEKGSKEDEATPFNFDAELTVTHSALLRVENVDVTPIVKGHTDYGRRMGLILLKLGLAEDGYTGESQYEGSSSDEDDGADADDVDDGDDGDAQMKEVEAKLNAILTPEEQEQRRLKRQRRAEKRREKRRRASATRTADVHVASAREEPRVTGLSSCGDGGGETLSFSDAHFGVSVDPVDLISRHQDDASMATSQAVSAIPIGAVPNVIIAESAPDVVGESMCASKSESKSEFPTNDSNQLQSEKHVEAAGASTELSTNAGETPLLTSDERIAASCATFPLAMSDSTETYVETTDDDPNVRALTWSIEEES